jgi:hypothetical protein
MPEKRGRRRRRRERGAGGAHADTPSNTEVAAPAVRAASAQPAVPSNTARATGFAIAVITVFLAILTVADAFAADRAAVDATVRAIVGVFLVLLGIVVGVLSLFPAQVRRMIRGE